MSPLHLATNVGNVRIVRKLLLSGANKWLLNAQLQIPLEIAIENKYHAIAQILVTFQVRQARQRFL